MNKQEQKRLVKVVHRRNYNLLQKIFCCKIFHCCQHIDQTLLTWKDRRQMFMKLSNNLSMLQQYETISPFYMLMAILFCDKNSEIYLQLMQRVSIHSDKDQTRQDLEFYIPQLCTFLVFHQQMQNKQLINLMERACKNDIYFAQRFYFYIKSLESINQQEHIHIVKQYLKRLNGIMCQRWKITEVFKLKQIQSYHKRSLAQKNQKQILKLEQLLVQNPYQPLYKIPNQNQISSFFQSTLDFVEDLLNLAQKLIIKANRKQYLIEQLRKINMRLPARVNIPFLRGNIRSLTILSVVFQESKVFSTKQRAPYYICLQAFSNSISQKNSLHGLTRRKSSDVNQQTTQNIHKMDESTDAQLKSNGSSHGNSHIISSIQTKYQILNRFFQLTQKGKRLLHLNQEGQNELEQKDIGNNNSNLSQKFDSIFPQKLQNKINRIGKYSPYSNLPQYKLITLIVKSNDNLKQQQFAMQLLQYFNQIFLQQQIKLKLYPYQIISTSPNSGVIQYLEDCITIDQLKKKDSSLQQVVIGKSKLKRFVRSLAAYSLITWLLQVKDRHNGNIMICRDGSIRHIDYGFFISNSPGKGVEIQKAIPFKMSAQYINVLGGSNSKYFNEFRKLFSQGYIAARKHQDKIVTLVKLMYSSHGQTMPCFQKGQKAIQQLQYRFNPVQCKNDIQTSLYCQNLINTSMDNWRARWYDKWQYYAQGIFY